MAANLPGATFVFVLKELVDTCGTVFSSRGLIVSLDGNEEAISLCLTGAALEQQRRHRTAIRIVKEFIIGSVEKRSCFVTAIVAVRL